MGFIAEFRRYTRGLAGIVHLCFWTLLFVFIYHLSALNMPEGEAFVRSVLVLLCHVLNFYAIFVYIIPRYFETRKYWQGALWVLALQVVLFPVRYYIESEYELLVHIALMDLPKPRTYFRIIVVSDLAIAGFATLLRLSLYSFETKQKMVEMEKSHLETELRFLKSQISPHFLFNTINNLYSLILLKSENAAGALLKLSSLLRYLLYECNAKVSLQKELSALSTYTDLFQLRYEEPLDIKIEADIKKTEGLIEPMLLVPLLENAIKHSAIGAVPGAFVYIYIKEMTVPGEGKHLLVDFKNTKSPIKQDVSEAGGIGLANIKRRLEMSYPGKYSLSISDENLIFEVNLKIPVG